MVHVRPIDEQDPPATRVGFVVSKKVGNAVTRNRVKRRLRHIVRGYMPTVGTDVGVRALPDAARCPERLEDDLRDAWRRAHRKAGSC